MDFIPISITLLLIIFTVCTVKSDNDDPEDLQFSQNYIELNSKYLDDSKSKDYGFEEEPGPKTISESIEYISLYYQKAVSIEKRYEELQKYKVYSEQVKRVNADGKAIVEKHEKLNDRLENLMLDAKQGKLKSSDYKEALIQIDGDKKKVHGMYDIFSANISAVKQAHVEFEQLIESLDVDIVMYKEFGKEEFDDLITQVESTSVNLLDTSVKGFASGAQIDFDLDVMTQLKEKYEQFEALKIKQDNIPIDSEAWTILDKEIKDYEFNEILSFIKANKKMFGRFLPAIGASTVRIKINQIIAENLISSWGKQNELTEKIYIEIAAAEARYRKVVMETAVLLKAMIRDEL